MNYFWEKDEVLGKLDLKMTSAYFAVSELSRREQLSMRDAAYAIAIGRGAKACHDRGSVYRFAASACALSMMRRAASAMMAPEGAMADLKTVIADLPVFDRHFWDDTFRFTRIGTGALGGKASGLAFAKDLLAETSDAF